jgi:uncharacterized delta-60 repeat protein
MPLLGTRGAASASGFGFTALTGIGGPYWIGTLSNGANGANGQGIAVDSSGNIYITGYASISGSRKAIISKYNNSGVIQWQRSLGSSFVDYSYSVSIDSSGNVYITGITPSPSGGADNDVLIAKYNTSGTLQWQRTLGASTSGAVDNGQSIAVDSSGNVYVAGRTSSQGAGSDDVLIAKYNTSGTIQWQRILGGSGSDIGQGIAVDSSGNVYVTGYTSNTGIYKVLLTKYNTSGTIQWQRTLVGSGMEFGYGITVDSAGNIYIVGYTGSNTDALITKYDTSGTIQWQRTLSGSATDAGYGISVDLNGNVYITGATSSQGAGSTDALIAKYNNSGTIQWQRTLGGSGNDYCIGISVDSGGNIYTIGITNTPSAGAYYDFLLSKLPGDGSKTGTYTVSGASFTYATSTLTAATSTLTDAASTLTAATSTLTDAAGSETSATSTLTSSVTTI